jgi:bacterioferritin (cytochrome b1)
MPEESIFSRKPNILPPIETYQIEPIHTELTEKDLNLGAVRRQKIRELRDMGYRGEEIYKVIKKGIMINDIPYFTDVTLGTIKNDLSYLMQEDLAADKSFPEKKVEIRSKYEMLFRQAMLDYAVTRGQSKVSFLNAAKSILDKITELEGVAAPKISFEKKLIGHTKASVLAGEIKEGSSKDDQHNLITAIDTVLKERKRGRVGGVSVAPKTSRVRASSSDDGEISN